MSSSTQDSPETYSFAIRAGLPVDAALRTRVAVLMERKATEQAWRELLVGSAQEVEEAKEAFAYRLAAAHRAGLSYRRLGAMLGVSYATVMRVIQRAGVVEEASS